MVFLGLTIRPVEQRWRQLVKTPLIENSARSRTAGYDFVKTPSRPRKQRADQLLVSQGLCESRSRAQALILAGQVYFKDQRVNKAGAQLPVDTPLHVRETRKYVSRGGDKLEAALADLSFNPAGYRVADIGASTGGFTDCLLCHEAHHVYAIDVGHGQLADKLRRDARVTVLERTNARHVTQEQLDGAVDLVVVDASFIGLAKLLPAISALLQEGGFLLALIKPQFEVGRWEASKSAGVIRDATLRQTAIEGVLQQLAEHGFEPLKDTPCRLPGPKGNVEHFSLSRKLQALGRD